MTIAQTMLESVLPGATVRSIATATVGQDSKTVSVRIASLPFGAPPVLDAINRKLGGVVGGADEQGATVGLQIVHPVGYGDTIGVGAEVVVVDEHGLTIPLGALILESTDEFLLLCIDADDRQALGSTVFSQFGDLGELCVSVRM
jgi:hypothetical protein